jgi:transposase
LIHSEEWLAEIPNAVKQGGVHQLAQAFETNFKKMAKQNSKKGFTIHFRSRKKLVTEVISKLDKQTTRFLNPSQKSIQLSFMPKYLKSPLLLVDSERAIHKMKKWRKPPCDFKIQYHCRTKEWYCLFPYPLEEQQGSKEQERGKHSVVALDPGARTFLTAYSPSAGCGKLMVGALDRPKQLAERIDQLTSMVVKLKQLSREDRREAGYGENCIRNRMKKIHRLHKKIYDIRHHLHYSTIHFLVDNFEAILLPNFQTQKMIQKETRNIHQTTVKDLLSWGHYQFKMRLLSKAMTSGT